MSAESYVKSTDPKVRRGLMLLAAARLLGRFAQFVQLKRSLEATDPVPHLNFWRLQYGGLSNLAALEWCKAFGSEGSNKLHWRKIFETRHDEFRAGLLSAVRMSEAEFYEYWKDIKHWRDTDFAHTDPDAVRLSKWPHFDTGLLAADYYYDLVLEELYEQEIYMVPRHLDHYRMTLSGEFSQAAGLALAATFHLPPSKP